jgi:hypothetical protein
MRFANLVVLEVRLRFVFIVSSTMSRTGFRESSSLCGENQMLERSKASSNYNKVNKQLKHLTFLLTPHFNMT